MINLSVFTLTPLPENNLMSIESHNTTLQDSYYKLHALLGHLLFQHQCWYQIIFHILRSYSHNYLLNIVNSVNGRRFLAEYGRLIKDAYPVSNVQNNNYRTGKYLTLFPFKRMFVVCQIWFGRLSDLWPTEEYGKSGCTILFQFFTIFAYIFWYFDTFFNFLQYSEVQVIMCIFVYQVLCGVVYDT